MPVLSGHDLVKLLSKAGFVAAGQRGSHVKLKKRLSDRVLVTVVPLHKALDVGTLLGILRQAEVSREDFLQLLEK
ncbi:MAG: type II toxin-antitoxin system HicA family toxin [Candidatus Micrarchaeota archaeon]